jgi:superfamily II DNA/RNA helicase
VHARFPPTPGRVPDHPAAAPRRDPAGETGHPRRRRDEKARTISIRNELSALAIHHPDNEPAPAPEQASDEPRTFAALGVAVETVEALNALGIVSPFPIQVATIPVALTGADVIGQAKTGTGKTLAFGVPVLQRVAGPSLDPEATNAAVAASVSTASGSKGSARRRRSRGSGASASATIPAHGSPQALVVVPTRELAIQVTNDLLAAGKVRAIRVHALYGGRAYEPQVAALRAGIDIAVGTPGRLLDLARQHHLELGGVRTLVLDEADEMLDLGFLPDVERIIAQLSTDRQTMLFSATMPGEVISLARRYMSRPTHIRAADPADPGVTLKNIAQFVYRAHSLDKVEMLSRILQAEGRGLAMVFARTKRTVAKIAEELSDRHFAVAAVHGDLGQGVREQALRAFRNGKIDVLVATDVAARGIDVEGVTHVVNFQCPEDEKVYTHRIGRTGRAGAKGNAVTFVDWDEVPRWQLINKALDLPYPEPAELYSTSPQLYSDLGIPEGVKGVLPRQERVREGLDAEEIEDLGETGRARRPGGRGTAQHSAAKSERPARMPRQRNRTRRGEKLPAVRTDDAPEIDVSGAAPTIDDVLPGRPVDLAGPTGETVVAAQKTLKTPRTRTRTRSKGATSGEGVSIKLTPGSLADPEARPSDPQAAVKTGLEAAGLADAESSAAAPARRRTRTRRSAPPKAEAESVKALADRAQIPDANGNATATADDADLNTGPVANPRRTRARSTRTAKSSTLSSTAEPRQPTA